MQERAPIFGITLEEPATVPENVGLPHGIEIPCPVEQKIQDIAQKLSLDRKDPKVVRALDVIRQIRLNHPDSGFKEALTDNHVKNMEKGRWDRYIPQKTDLAKS